MKRKTLTLYQPICRLCHFVVPSTTDLGLIKQLMNNHLVKSHHFTFDYANKYPISDYAESFKIIRTHNPSPQVVLAIREAESRPAFYEVACRPKIPSVSGLSSGEKSFPLNGSVYKPISWYNYLMPYKKPYYSEYKKHYYQENKERLSLYDKEYRRTHPMTPEMRKRRNELATKRLKERRQKVLQTLGNQCYVCGSPTKLELHHKNMNQSPYGKVSQATARWKTLKEAEQYPERFFLLCFKHHLITSIALESPESKKRLLEVINATFSETGV